MFQLFALLSTLAFGARAQDAFEAEQFNVVDALREHGINASTVTAYEDSKARPEARLRASPCSFACRGLEQIYGRDKLLRAHDAAYDEFTGSFWSLQQANVNPACVFRPNDSKAVAVVILWSRLTTCPFAFKSGGHTAFVGGSNIAGGITVDFSLMNEVKLNEDKTVASFQPGLTWSQVYAELAKDEVAILGGRVAPVGVSGLTLGGGISFFSPRQGLACDNIVSFEVVTAQGLLVTASPTSYPDLYWALRGGSSNFGIVTRFNVRTIPLPKNELWGGSKIFLEPATPAVIDAYYNMIMSAASDPDAGGWLALLGSPRLVIQELYYGKPDAADAPIFSEFTNIQPLIADSTQTRTLLNYTRSIAGAEPGRRQLYGVITIKTDLDLLTYAKDVFYEKIGPAVAAAGNDPVAMTIQSFTKPVLERMTQNGGNPLGLRADEGPYTLIQIASAWPNSENDELFYRSTSDILGAIRRESEARGKGSPWVYINYAAPFQDVFAGYGAENKRRLQRIAAKYDPKRVFETLQPGYFKLDRAAVPNSPYFRF